MNLVTILGFLKAVLPTKRIAAWVVGLLAALVAVIMGVNNAELKAQYCSTAEVVSLPALPDKPPVPPEPAKVAPAAKVLDKKK